MYFNYTNQDGKVIKVPITKHAYERFCLRYSLLYYNIIDGPIQENKLKIVKYYNNGEVYRSEMYEKNDKAKGRNVYYIKCGFLVFVINKENGTIITVKCSEEFNKLNAIELSPRLLRTLKKRDRDKNRFSVGGLSDEEVF